MRRIAILLALLLAATGMLTGCSLPDSVSLAAKPSTSTGPLQGNGIVIIKRGDSGRAIARSLEEAGVTHADHFAFLTQRDPDANLIQPGTYRLSIDISPDEALAQLLDGAHKDPGFVIIEGARASKVYSDLASRLRVSEAEVLAAASLIEKKSGPLEGRLFPATYDIDGSTPSEALKIFLSRFKQQDIASLKAKAKALGYSLDDILTIASMIQVEVAPKDYAKAARVIYNRLENKIPLQLDSTVNYALGSSVLSLDASALATDSPYNTYLHPGLPPTPISNPGVKAINAALAPESGSWRYWVTVNPDKQKTEFATTGKEFKKLKAKYLKWKAAHPS
jgi:UPF0755 protein